MLTNEEHQAMIMFDRLLMLAKDNETIADLLDQTLNVARMLDPRPDDKVVYGPLQRMHFEWQQMKYRMSELDKKMDNYINSQNRYGVPPSTWPPNSGMWGPIGFPQNELTISTSGTSGYQAGYGPTPNIKPLTATDIANMVANTPTWTQGKQTSVETQVNLDNQMERLREQLRNITKKVSSEDNVQPPTWEAK
jgi:hypothetical protein